MRVQSWKRPSRFLEVSNFEPRIRRWTDLEQVNFWHLPDDDEFYTAAGFLNVDYSGPADSEDQASLLNDHIWRVAGREGRLLTVELAAFADGQTLAGLLQPKIQWVVRRRLTGMETEQMPGWTSTVDFKTRPGA